jgi:hypothetical protein
MTKNDRSVLFDAPIWKKALNKPFYATKKLRRKFGHMFEDTIRFSTQNPDDWGIVNQNEIRLVGLRRSGNHVLINWMRHQDDSVVQFLNDIPTGENPYRYRCEYFCDCYPEYPDEIQRLRQQSQGNFKKKDYFIYNYEDYSLAKVFNSEFEKKHDWYVGKSGRRFDVLIMRDPFNLLASRIKRGFIHVKSSDRTFVELWKEYAKEYLGETNYSTQNKVCVNYNRWIRDIDYRRSLAETLGFKFSDANFSNVAGNAGGSSFDGTQYAQQASKMDVVGRWKHYQDDEFYRQLLSDRELLEYSDRIFGKIPGIEALQLT